MKTNTKDLERLTQMFGALSNPNRLRIFLRLVACYMGATCNTDGEHRPCVGDLGQDIGVAQSTVSHHIKELRRAGLIHTARHGQKIKCWVNPETWQDLTGFFTHPSDGRFVD